tara:strand:- start:848 stop:1039 length:192 start_codon:yes stop_codon:yes gene_type:complete
MKNLSLQSKIETATKLATFDAIEKSAKITDLALRTKLITKYISTVNFQKAVEGYLKLINEHQF